MPKDPTKNIFQYKIRGGHLNEFEFQKNQGEVTEQKGRPWETENFDPNAQPEAVLNDDGKGRKKTAGKQGKSAATGANRKPPAKATKKTAQKKAAKATKKSAPKKSVTKKPAGRKASATGRAKRATKK